MIIYNIYSASQKKGNPQIKLIFLKNAMICQKTFTLLQNSVYPLFVWHQLQDVLAMHGQARTIWNGHVKIDLCRIGI